MTGVPGVMKALVLREWGRPLRMAELPIPEPGPGEVLVRVRACGIGYTLTNIRRGRMSGSPGAGVPRVIGHEVAGDVVRVGPGVDGWYPGRRGLVYFYLTCGRCAACRHGHDPLCGELRGLVGVAADGGLAEYMKVPAANLVSLPEEIDYVTGSVVADAVATPWHALRAVARLRPLEDVAVFGAGGGVGIHAVQVAKRLGGRVVAIDLGDEKLRFAMEHGADWTVDARAGDVAAELRRHTGGRGVDVVLDYVATPETTRAGYDCLAPGGRLVFQGINPPNTLFQAEPRNFIHREVMVAGARYASRRELVEAVEAVRRGLLQPVVTRTGRLEDAESFFELLDRQTLLGRAAVVFP